MNINAIAIGFTVLFAFLVIYVIIRVREASESNDRLGE